MTVYLVRHKDALDLEGRIATHSLQIQVPNSGE